jgi:hypothetical protein
MDGSTGSIEARFLRGAGASTYGLVLAESVEDLKRCAST